jgi:hypothetical protein
MNSFEMVGRPWPFFFGDPNPAVYLFVLPGGRVRRIERENIAANLRCAY